MATEKLPKMKNGPLKHITFWYEEEYVIVLYKVEHIIVYRGWLRFGWDSNECWATFPYRSAYDCVINCRQIEDIYMTTVYKIFMGYTEQKKGLADKEVFCLHYMKKLTLMLLESKRIASPNSSGKSFNILHSALI